MKTANLVVNLTIIGIVTTATCLYQENADQVDPLQTVESVSDFELYANGNLEDEAPAKNFESGYIKARNRIQVRVFPENADNSKGSPLFNGWLQQDETRPISTERGRIIFDYRYSESDNWTTDVHAWCRSGNTVSIP